VSIGGKDFFACVDGPEFDGHKVDFDLLADRQTSYREFEQAANACGPAGCRVGLTHA
jgi:ferredoxin--NADP+ reductase